jgi:hypothetical protein
MSTSQPQVEEAQEKRRQKWRQKLLPAIIQAQGSSCLQRWGPTMYYKAMNLAMAGIPTSIRGEIWKAVVGNRLRITPALFEM